MGYANYVGRVGALAVALGIGTAVASMPGVAWADPDAGVSSSVDGTASRNDVTSDDGAGDAGSADDSKAADDTDADEQEDVDADEEDPQDGGDPIDVDLEIDGAEPPEPADLSEDDLEVILSDGDDVEEVEEVEIEVPQPTKRRTGSSQQADGQSEAQNPSVEGGMAPEVSGEAGEVGTGATPAPPPASPPVDVPTLPNSAVLEQISAPERPAQPATDSVSVASVLSSVLSPLSSSDGAVPVGSPLAWGLLAFARRQLGQQQDTVTGQPQMVVAALVDNAAPTGRVSVGAPGWFTARVSGRVFGSDADRDPLTYTGPMTTAKGSVVVDQRGRFTYTPSDSARHAAARTGATEADKTDSFVVTLDDGNGGVTPVAVTVRIRPANDRPDSSGSVGLPNMADGVVSGVISTVDDDQDPLTYRASETTKGSVVFNSDGTFTYTPTEEAREAAGNRRAWSAVRRESFTVTVDDGHGGTDSVRITVPISAIDNEAPVLDGVDEGNPSFFGGSVSGRVNATDGDGDRLTYAGSASTAKGRVTVYSSGRFTYTPSAAARHAAAATGASEADKTDNFTVTVTDAFGGSLSVPVTIDISPKNAAPSSARARATAPNATTGVVTITVTGRDSDGDTMTFSSPAATPKGALVNNGNGTFTYTPTDSARQAAGAPGAPAAAKTDALTFTLTDGHGGSRTASVNVGIAPSTANGAPTGGVANPGQPGADGKVSGTVTATDPNGDPLSYAGTGNTTRGSVVVNTTGSFVYTPSDAARHAAAANGAAAALKQDSFTVTVSDGKGGTLAVPVTVTIAPKNTAPVVSSTVGTPNPASGLVTGSVTSTDADADVRTYAAPALSTKGGAVAINSTTGGFTYTPTAAARQAAAAAGATAADKTDTFTVTVNDGHLGGAVTVTLSVAIAPAANGAPTGGSANPGSPGADGKVSGTVTATDPNGDPLTYSGSGATAKGSVIVNANGTFLYTPSDAARHSAAANGAAAALKQDSFTVTVSDGRGGTLGVPVTVTISPMNSAPVGSFTAGAPNSANGAVTGAVTSTDADGDARTYSGPAVSVKGGTLVVNSDGTFSYTPTAALREAAAASGAPASAKVDSFSVTINDGHLNGTTTVNVQVDIAPAVAETTSPAPISGIPLSNGLVGTTGSIFQPIASFDEQLSPSTFVRVYDSSGAVIGDTATITGNPAAPIVRSDGGITIVTYDSVAGTATVHVVSASATVTATTFTAGGSPSFLGGSGRQYMLVGYRDSANRPVVNIVPLSAGAVESYSVTGLPVVGPDGTIAALQVTGASSEDASAVILVIDAEGQTRTMTAPELLTSGISFNVTVAPDGTVYLPTLVQLPTGVDSQTGLATEVLVFDPSGSVSKSPVIADMRPAAGVVVAADGTAHLLTTPFFAPDGSTPDTYMVSIVTGGGLINTPPFTAPFWDPQILGASPGGTLYVLINDSDDDVNRVVVVRPSGSLSTVTLGEFSFSDPYVIGKDDNLYMTYRFDGEDVLAVVSSTGQTRVLPFSVDLEPFSGGPQLAFDDDGTAYAVVSTEGGVVVRISEDGFATWRASSPVDITRGYLQIGPNGTAYLVSDSSGAIVTAIDRTGRILATVVDDAGTAVGPVVFAENGIAYVTVLNGNPAEPTVTTTVWAITASGVSKVTTVSGFTGGAAPGSPSSTPLVSFTGDGKLILTTVVVEDLEQMVFSTQLSLFNEAPAPVSPWNVTTVVRNTATGVVQMQITDSTAGSGTGEPVAVTYSGSTTSPLGTVVVNPDGTVVFTPNAAARQLANDANRPLYAAFFVTATDGLGNANLIPVTARLLPDNPPADVEPTPRRFREILALPGGIGPGGKYSWQSLFTSTDAEWKRDPATGQWLSYKTTLTRVSSLDASDWPTDPQSGLPESPDVYVVSVLNLGGNTDGLVTGYRKMELGDAITVKFDVPRPDGTPWVEYAPVAFAVGTFPTELFRTRFDPDGEVGGYMFNNEIDEEDFQAWQADWDEYENIRNAAEEARLKAPLIQGLGNATQTGLELFGGAGKGTIVVKGIRSGPNGLELITDYQETEAQYGDRLNPVFVIEGVEYTPPPQIGI
ncbi:MAG: Ig-like domain-containing protein [Mycobacterium sp.]